MSKIAEEAAVPPPGTDTHKSAAPDILTLVIETPDGKRVNVEQINASSTINDLKSLLEEYPSLCYFTEYQLVAMPASWKALKKKKKNREAVFQRTGRPVEYSWNTNSILWYINLLYDTRHEYIGHNIHNEYTESTCSVRR